jgi:hypothetical protein
MRGASYSSITLRVALPSGHRPNMEIIIADFCNFVAAEKQQAIMSNLHIFARLNFI